MSAKSTEIVPTSREELFMSLLADSAVHHFANRRGGNGRGQVERGQG